MKKRIADMGAGIAVTLYALYCLCLFIYNVYPAMYREMTGEMFVGGFSFGTLVFVLGFFVAGYLLLSVITSKQISSYVLAILGSVLALYSCLALLYSGNGDVAVVTLFSTLLSVVTLLILAGTVLLILFDTLPELQGMKRTKKILGLVLTALAGLFFLLFAIYLILDLVNAGWSNHWFRYVADALFLLFALGELGGIFLKEEAEVKMKEPLALDSSYRLPFALHVVLLFVTLGVWQLIWTYRTTVFTNAAKDEHERDPLIYTLLYFFVPGFSIFWTYKTAKRVDKIAAEQGVESSLTKLCLILSIFVAVVPPILLQRKINEIFEGAVPAPAAEPAAAPTAAPAGKSDAE